MLALGPWCHRNVSAVRGGPIAGVQVGEMPFFGEKRFLAHAVLVPGLRAQWANRALYSRVDGTGVHEAAQTARHMAISEALERWAHGAASRDAALSAKYGFDVDPTTNGMAAYPSLLPAPARIRAWEEAMERHAIRCWWEDRCGATLRETEWPGVTAIEILGPQHTHTVIAWRYTAFDLVAYGHAASQTFLAALDHALIELARHELALRYRWFGNGAGPEQDPLSDIGECRAWYFSTPEGHDRFLRRVNERVEEPCPEPEIIFDGEVFGPWSAYTHIWRVVCRPYSDAYLKAGKDYFFW